MSEEGYFNIWLNPLQIFNLDYPGIDETSGEMTLEEFVTFFCVPGVDHGLADFVERYHEINKENPRWHVPPNEQNILEKIVWPLRQAKANYVLGNCLATIALCGMVAEMLAILLFEINTITVNGQPITESEQDSIFGSKFEKLAQSRRVKVLKAYSIIGDDLAENFGKVAASRNRYLHNWSADHEKLELDARETYLATVAIAVAATGQRFHEGRVYMAPALVRYLQQRGVYRPKDSNE